MKKLFPVVLAVLLCASFASAGVVRDGYKHVVKPAGKQSLSFSLRAVKLAKRLLY